MKTVRTGILLIALLLIAGALLPKWLQFLCTMESNRAFRLSLPR